MFLKNYSKQIVYDLNVAQSILDIKNSLNTFIFREEGSYENRIVIFWKNCCTKCTIIVDIHRLKQFIIVFP